MYVSRRGSLSFFISFRVKLSCAHALFYSEIAPHGKADSVPTPDDVSVCLCIACVTEIVVVDWFSSRVIIVHSQISSDSI